MSIEFKLILVVVDIERSGKVLDAVLASGATGATILGQGKAIGLTEHTEILSQKLSG